MRRALELESARAEMLTLEEGLKWESIRAPLSGVVLAPKRTGKEAGPGRPGQEGRQAAPDRGRLAHRGRRPGGRDRRGPTGGPDRTLP